MNNGKINSAILLAAGKGSRMKSNVKKQFLKLGSKYVFEYSLDKLINSGLFRELIIVASPEDYDFFRPFLSSRIKLTSGGERRQDSVCKGLECVRADCDVVVIHDSARPLFPEKQLGKLIAAAFEYGSATLAVNVKDTIKVAGKDGFFKQNLDRANLYNVQTPQAFSKKKLAAAYEKIGNSQITYTDDTAVIETLGIKTKIIEGSYENIKLTTMEDFEFVAGKI